MQLYRSYFKMVVLTTQTATSQDKLERKNPSYGRLKQGCEHVNPITTGELVEALKSMKAGKVPGPDDIHLEFSLHAGDVATKWLCQFMSTCLEGCKIPKLWRKATVIALPKPNKPMNEP